MENAKVMENMTVKNNVENMTVLCVKGLCKKGILKDISFSMSKGEMVAVMGPSGSGKSTLLYNVSGMDQADGGEAWLGDNEIVSLSEDRKAELRLHKMGFVFQQMNVIKNLNIIDNIMLPSVHANKSSSFRKSQLEKAKKLMRDFHIEDLADRKVSEVSGGQLQRACICRSMMMDPEILFADEPTGALNQRAAEEAIDAFLKINEEGTSLLMVTHDSRIASRCQRILFILDGEIKSELELGKYTPGQEKEREKTTGDWLASMNW